MNFRMPPPLRPSGESRAGDDLDGLLRAFFRAELPQPWPPFRPPTAQTTRSARFRSALALAAALALLVIGLGALPRKLEPAPTVPPGHFGSAQREKPETDRVPPLDGQRR